MLADFFGLIEHYHVLAAFWMTIRLTVISAIGAFVVGLIVAILRVCPVPALRLLGALYVNLVRNTPLTLILFFGAVGLSFYANWGLGTDNLKDSNFRWGIVALVVYHATFVAEALRSGVNTVPKGQAEAARAIGLSFGQTLGGIVLPQALRASITPLANVLIALTKNTTILATVGVAEASLAMKNMIEFNPNFLYLIFIVVALGFVILTLPTGVLSTWLSKRLAVRR